MAKFNMSLVFKNCEIDLAEGTITEIGKEDIKVYRLLDELKKFEGRQVDLTIKEVKELEPVEEE